jgi:hypothetical protein
MNVLKPLYLENDTTNKYIFLHNRDQNDENYIVLNFQTDRKKFRNFHLNLKVNFLRWNEYGFLMWRSPSMFVESLSAIGPLLKIIESTDSDR